MQAELVEAGFPFRQAQGTERLQQNRPRSDSGAISLSSQKNYPSFFGRLCYNGVKE